MLSAASRERTSTDTSDWDIDHQIPGAFPEPVTPQAVPSVSTQQSLAQAVHVRRKEYTEPKKIRIKIGSWNVASLKGTEKDIGGWFIEGRGVEEPLTGLTAAYGVNNGLLRTGDAKDRETVEEQELRRSKHHETLPKGDAGSVPGREDVGLYVLGLQEIVDIGSLTEALRPTTDPTPSNKIKSAIDEVLPLGYQLVAQEQLIGLLLLVYANAEVLPHVQNVSTTSVGTGLGGYMGNKGAVTARIILGDTTRLVFVNSHLAAGADKAALERRNSDVGNIVSRTRFAPIIDPLGATQPTGEQIGDEDYAFWFGDLNYRLQDIPGDQVRRLLMLHTRNEYDLAQAASALKIDSELNPPGTSPTSLSASDKASLTSAGVDSTPSGTTSIAEAQHRPPEYDIPPDEDPESLQTVLNSLLPHDELQQQMKAHRAFDDGWAEGPIRFLPTYKYDVGSVGMFDSSEKKRCPSWCDRILFRTRRRLEVYKQWQRQQEELRKKEAEAKSQLQANEADKNVLFDYGPEEVGIPQPPGRYDYDENEEVLDADHVITREDTDSEITLEYYISHQRVLSSDHKPLSAIFSLTYDAVIPEARQRVYEEVVRELDRAENEGRPTMTLIVDKSPDTDGTCATNPSSDVGTIDFGKVSAGERKRRSVTIANTGRVPATLTFVDRPTPDGSVSSPTPPWLFIEWDRSADLAGNPHGKSPKKGRAVSPVSADYTLEPGDACTIEILLHVEVAELIKHLDEDAASLDDILILRVQNGRDHFLPVHAKWVHSAVERSIAKLKSSVEDRVRRLQGQNPTADSVSHSSSRANLTDSPNPSVGS